LVKVKASYRISNQIIDEEKAIKGRRATKAEAKKSKE